MPDIHDETREQGRVEVKVCFLATLSVWLLLASVPLFVLLAILQNFHYEMLVSIIVVPYFLCVISAPLMATVSLIRISLSEGRSIGLTRAWVVLVTGGILLGLSGVVSAPIVRRVSTAQICGSGMRGLGIALHIYASDNDDRFPPAEDWCDRLTEECDIYGRSFTCIGSDAERGESSYALNKAVAGRKMSEIPVDTVVLFETDLGNSDAGRDMPYSERRFAKTLGMESKHKVHKDRWNQSGGPEILYLGNHDGEGCNIVFADGQVRFVTLYEMAGLRWDVEGKAVFPSHLFEGVSKRSGVLLKQVGIPGMVVLLLIVSVVFVVRLKPCGYLLVALVIPVLSVIAGGILGGWSQIYYTLSGSEYAGVFFGALAGLSAGICYWSLIAATSTKIKDENSLCSYIISAGVATGAVCSTVVHVMLMVFHLDAKLNGIVGGMAFGMAAGAVLGLVTYFLVRVVYRKGVLKAEYPISNRE